MYRKEGVSRREIAFVFGLEVEQRSLHRGQDVRRIATMRELTGNCIVIYQRYLYDVLSQYKMLDMVAFIDPAMIGAIGCGKGQERSQHIKERLISAKPGQIFMLPYNSDKHWVLTIVDPEQEIVYFMDPMKR